MTGNSHVNSTPIEDYALLSDCHGAALVSRAGDIDWLALPRFDSAAMFARLVGKEENGLWSFSSTDAVIHHERRYLGDSLVLENSYRSAAASWTITDAMLIVDGFKRHLVRHVRCTSGVLHFRSRFVPRFDYGLMVPWARHANGTIVAINGPDACILRGPLTWREEDNVWICEGSLAAEQDLSFSLSWYPSHLDAPEPLDVVKELSLTTAWWENWAKTTSYNGAYRDVVIRSLLTLKALTYAPTGAFVAAPTTSLPEHVGGVRNWDYRYCWLRDATFTVLALLNGGFRDEAQSFVLWLMRAIAGQPADMQILYSVTGERRIEEWEATHLPGYAASKPVRIGNAAYTQEQFDVFGEIVDALFQAIMRNIPVHESCAEMLDKIVAYVRRSCIGQPDRGMWEIRGEPQIMVQSQVMVWVVLDRAMQLHDRGFLQGDAEQWRRDRDALHADICAHGYDPDRKSFVQSYGSKALDANLLLLPMVGFLPIDDPRITATVDAIERELLQFPFVKRYSTEEHPGTDGLPPGEGAFLACSFWLCDVYALQGNMNKAQDLFEALIACCNDLGLLAEEYDVSKESFLGNFPQAFSHLALVNTAHNLERVYGPAIQRSQRVSRFAQAFR